MSIAVPKKGIIKEAGKPMPIYKQVQRHLANEIKNGSVKHGDELPPIAKIVKEYDVSYQAVIMALDLLEQDGLVHFKNGRGRGKRPVVIKFEPNFDSCSMTFLRTTRDSLDLQITQGISRYEVENNLDSLVIDSPNSHEAFIEGIRNPCTDGLIILPYYHPEIVEAINFAMAKGVKVVLVDRQLEGTSASSVSIDHTHGAYMACNHLFENCNEPVFYFSDDSKLSSVRERYDGWRIAMAEHGHQNFGDYCKLIFNEMDGSYATIYSRDIEEPFLCTQYSLTLDFFKREKREFYNILTLNDYTAKAVCLAAEEMGLEIGGNVFIVSFGDYPFCRGLKVPLTSINQKNEEVGYEAAKLLHQKISGSFDREMCRKINPQLVIRQSSVGGKI